MGRTRSPPYSFLQTGCTWPLSLTTGEYLTSNIDSVTSPWKAETPHHDVSLAGLFASGSQERKRWPCRRERTGNLTDCAATIIHMGESLQRGNYPPHWSLGATWETAQLYKMLSFIQMDLSVPANTWNPNHLSHRYRTRDGHVRFWKALVTVPSLRHLCRSILRHSVSTHQIEPLPLPKRIIEYLTYRNIPDHLKTCRFSSEDHDWDGWIDMLTMQQSTFTASDFYYLKKSFESLI